MIALHLQRDLAKFTSKTLKTPKGKVTVFDQDRNVKDQFEVTPGLLFDRFVLNAWRNRPNEGEVTFKNEYGKGRFIVHICKTGLANPSESWQLDYEYPMVMG
jgi:hypothetical protein